jgi:carbon-monoxide dehydrogenase large subunit
VGRPAADGLADHRGHQDLGSLAAHEGQGAVPGRRRRRRRRRVARTADDAAEVVDVEYEQLDPVLDIEEGSKDGSPLVHDELGTNAVVHWSHGGGGDQGVFDSAPVQLRLRFEAPRITPSPIEPRGALASVVPAMGEFTLWTSTQIPHIARVTLSGTTGIPEHKLRIVAPDVGGAFGAKLNVYAEEALCLALAEGPGERSSGSRTAR